MSPSCSENQPDGGGIVDAVRPIGSRAPAEMVCTSMTSGKTKVTPARASAPSQGTKTASAALTTSLDDDGWRGQAEQCARDRILQQASGAGREPSRAGFARPVGHGDRAGKIPDLGRSINMRMHHIGHTTQSSGFMDWRYGCPSWWRKGVGRAEDVPDSSARRVGTTCSSPVASADQACGPSAPTNRS